MQTRFEIFTGYSPLLIPVCLMGGAVYAYFLYSKKNPWSKTWNYALAALRFVVVSILFFFLLDPFIRYVKSFSEKAVIVIAVDNSTSIKDAISSESISSLRTSLDKFKSEIEGNLNSEVEIRDLSGRTVKSAQEIAFDHPTTDLSGILQEIKSIYENRNLSQVILVSDGIANHGNSPLYTPFSFPIHTVGIGDTTQKNDLVVKSIYCNKVAFIGNKFPIVAEIQQNGYERKEITVRLLHKGNVLDKKTIIPGTGSSLQKVEFLVSSSSKGLQGYSVEIVPYSNESSTKNNSSVVYVDVIDTKSKVLLVSPSPHPDIQAIAKVLAKNENFEFSYYIPGITEWKEDRYGLVIFHNTPNRFEIGSEVMTKLLAQSVSAWFITGSEVNWPLLNGINGILRLEGYNSQVDIVSPALSSDFSSFSIQSANKDFIPKYPPIEAPFGDIKLGPSAKIVLYQKIGSTITDKPLLAVAENDGRKMAILLGTGIWQWSLQEFGQFQNQETFDEIVMKLVQYLCTTVDKRKLRVYPIKNEFLDSEKPTFQAEVYNGLYEKIYGQKIDLEITSESGKKSVYTFFNSENGNPFETSALPEGAYTYSAKSVVNNINETSSGQFLVKKISLEALSSTADYTLLRRLAGQNNGLFVSYKDLFQLLDIIKQNPPKGRAYSKEENESIINLTWIFFALLTIVSLEWFFRKYLGSY